MSKLTLTVSVVALCAALGACTHETPASTETMVAEAAPEAPAADPDAAQIAEATAFVARAESELATLSKVTALAYWANETNITDETDAAAAEAGAKMTKLAVSLANESKKYDVDIMPYDVARKIRILRSSITIPAPSREGAAEELSAITTDLSSTYGKGKFEYKGEMINLDEASTIIETSRDPEELKAVWEGWRTVSPPMKDEYAEMVALANEGARELGYPTLDKMWLSNYDMPPEEMEAEVQRLWGQVEPLYKDLHCYARTKLNAQYGDPGGPARQHVGPAMVVHL
jgi:peptidyl-dipeptidase A